MSDLITFTHAGATFRVQPANVQRVREQIAKAEKAGKPRLPKAQTLFPCFTPGMATAEYIRQFQELNSEECFNHNKDEYKAKRLEFTFANRAAPVLDPLQPEVFEEPDLDYVGPVKAAKRKPKATADAINALRFVAEEFNSSTAYRDTWLHKQVLAALAGA